MNIHSVRTVCKLATIFHLSWQDLSRNVDHPFNYSIHLAHAQTECPGDDFPDTDDPQPLSPAMLLTMRTCPAGPLPGQFLCADVYMHRCWRQVQFLAEQFWTRWRRQYLQSLQPRQNWAKIKWDLSVGDIVLMRDEQQHQNDWPLGRVGDVIRSKDGRVRKVKVEIVKEGEKKSHIQPKKELILLLPEGSTEPWKQEQH